jgi:hypothetical protein
MQSALAPEESRLQDGMALLAHLSRRRQLARPVVDGDREA